MAVVIITVFIHPTDFICYCSDLDDGTGLIRLRSMTALFLDKIQSVECSVLLYRVNN